MSIAFSELGFARRGERRGLFVGKLALGMVLVAVAAFALVAAEVFLANGELLLARDGVPDADAILQLFM